MRHVERGAGAGKKTRWESRRGDGGKLQPLSLGPLPRHQARHVVGVVLYRPGVYGPVHVSRPPSLPLATSNVSKLLIITPVVMLTLFAHLSFFSFFESSFIALEGFAHLDHHTVPTCYHFGEHLESAFVSLSAQRSTQAYRLYNEATVSTSFVVVIDI